MLDTYPRHLLLTIVFGLETAAADVPAASTFFLVGLAAYHISRKVNPLPDRRKMS